MEASFVEVKLQPKAQMIWTQIIGYRVKTSGFLFNSLKVQLGVNKVCFPLPEELFFMWCLKSGFLRELISVFPIIQNNSLESAKQLMIVLPNLMHS